MTRGSAPWKGVRDIKLQYPVVNVLQYLFLPAHYTRSIILDAVLVDEMNAG